MISPKPFSTALLKWYDKNKRALPWRQDTAPYRVMVSELMLQQTQVKTVLPYYEKFLKKFPTAKKLALAKEQDVLAAWAGLGYYRRARFLHEAAKKVSLGKFPDTAEGLSLLPGVGEYTAAAIASISFGLPVAVVDGNVIRVISRLLALEEEASQGKGLAAVKILAAQLLDKKRPGDFNQAVMELGALICSPRAPACAFCPVSKFCKAYAQGKPELYPRLPEAATVTRVRKLVALIQHGNKILCAPRSEGGRMIGYWHFPEMEISPAQDAAKAAMKLALKMAGNKAKALGKCGVITHTITRYRISVEAFRFSASAKPKDPWRWVDLSKMKELPLASAEKRLLGLLEPPAGPMELPFKMTT